jgi:hypothetical protein
MSTKTVILFVFVYCIILNARVNSLIIVSPPEIAGQYFNSPRIDQIGPPGWYFEAVGRLALFNDTNPANKILIGQTGASDAEAARRCVEKNPLAIISVQSSSPVDMPGLASYAWDGTDATEVMLRTLQISYPSALKLYEYLNTYPEVIVKIVSNERNLWTEVFTSPMITVFRVILSVMNGLPLLLAAKKLYLFVTRKGCERNIPQLVLIFEIVANTLRIIAVTVDPIQSQRIFPYLLNQVLFTVSWPFSLMATLLITFYWHELIGKTNVNLNNFLAKMKIPFWCTFGVLLVVEVLSGVVRGAGFSISIFKIIVGTLYIVLDGAIAIFFLVTGVRLVKALKKMANVATNMENRVRRLKETTQLIYLSSVIMIIWAIGTAIGGLSPWFWIPWGFYCLWFLGFFLFGFYSLLQIMAIHPPKPPSGPRSTGGQNTPAGTSAKTASIKSDDSEPLSARGLLTNRTNNSNDNKV